MSIIKTGLAENYTIYIARFVANFENSCKKLWTKRILCSRKRM